MAIIVRMRANPYLRSCCCGCSLLIGVYIIAVLDLLGALAGFGQSVAFLASDSLSTYNILGFYAPVTGWMAFLAVWSAIALAASIGGIVGAVKRNTQLLEGYVIFKVAALVMAVIQIVYGIVYIQENIDFLVATYASQGTAVDTSGVQGLMIGTLVGSMLFSITLQIYFIIVIVSMVICINNGMPVDGSAVVVVQTQPVYAVQQPYPQGHVQPHTMGQF